VTTTAPAGLDADLTAERAIRGHHAAMDAELSALVGALVDAAAAGRDGEGERAALLRWLDEDLVPHAAAEERALYPVAAATVWGHALVDGMLREHVAIVEAVEKLRSALGPVRAAAAANAVRALFAVHLVKENELIVPPLVASADVSVAHLLDGMHELLGLGGQAHGSGGGCACGQGGCGGHGGHGGGAREVAAAETLTLDARLDVRPLSHGERHQRIFASVGRLAEGEALVLINDHDPVPLRYQMDAQQPGAFGWEYLQQGPDVWQVRITRL
jgi:uncharacterized protein (DUF2249 family)